MQRNMFHDIRPPRKQKNAVPSRLKKEQAPSKKRKEEPASSESDFFSYVKGEGRVSEKTQTKKTPRKPRTPRRPRKPLFDPKELTPVGNTQRKSNHLLWWISTGGIVVIAVVLLSMFSGATVVITPRQETVFIDGTFAAEKEVDEQGIQPSISYQTMILSVEKERDVSAAGEEEVVRRASGRIVVYNAFSDADQRLVKRTRFEDPEGHIYRIDESIVVPGMTEVDGEMVPGSIEVMVYAEEPGEEYNIGLTDFTVPGFKDSRLMEQYESFYGRSKTEMEGGFIGTTKVPEEKDLVAARAALEFDITQALYEQLLTQVPGGYLFVEESEHIRFEHEDPVEVNDETVRLVSKGFLQIAIVNERELAQFIAEQSIPGYAGENIFLLDSYGDGLTVSARESVVLEEDAEDSDFSITLTGSAPLVWDIDSYTIRTNLPGLEKSMFDIEMKGYPDIVDATASVRPFWKSRFPEESEDIHIIQIINGEKREE